MYGLLPSWLVPGLADRWLHRRTRIENSPGTRESLIHSLMMSEIGFPIALTLLYEVNPLLLTVQSAAAVAHEATAVWDVRTAHHSDREIKPVEQHVHSFLESLPFGALASLMCLHPGQVELLLRGGRGERTAWRLIPRRRPLPRPYLAGITAGVLLCVVLPYAEESMRCARASARRAGHRDEAES
ncbi:diguanylate cyclase [Streptomyces sp. M600PL45_2]|uniref:Diguanylate cyclase n=2 Tax=Streptomyces marispadix TaxID=2922868 RepID=A0ABS9T4R7_9ACTN|nr:diguanylate cyclase [Streptomyces marispadix]